MSSGRRLLALLIVAGVAAAGIAGMLLSGRSRPESAAARTDPAVPVALTLAALERSGDHRLSEEQRRAILPLLRVLRDVDPAEVEPSRALARAIMEALTPEQRASVERLRERARAGREGGGRRNAVGAGGGRRPGPVGSAPGAAVRQRLLQRVIERLEAGGRTGVDRPER